MKRSMKRFLGLAMILVLLLSLMPMGVLAAQTEAYLISEDTVEFPGWPLAPDEICVSFVSVSDGTATLSLIEADPDYRVVVYEDSLWLTSYSGTETPDTKQFPVREGSEYSVYLSAVCYSNSNLDTWDCGGTLTYKLTSSAPVRDVIQLPPEDPKQIVDDAYALEEGLSLPYEATLTGQIVAVNTSWSEQYQNITVTMLVEGKEIRCYRLAGEGAKELTLDDTITVTGTLTNYYGTIEFQQGCILSAVEKGDYEVPIPPEDPRLIVDEAYALAPGAALPYEATLTGRIVEILSPYDEDYRNITVEIVIDEREDKPIVCYRMRGDGTESLALGDIITVTGNLKNYTKTDVDTGDTTSTIEFSPCTLIAIGGTPDPVPGGWGPDSLALAGSGIPGLREWDPADPAGHMTQISANVYEKTVDFQAGTSIEFKIVGNDVWDDQWVFGCDDPELSVQIPLNQALPLGQGGGSWNLQLFIEEACTVRFIVDLNPLQEGGEALLILETDTPPPVMTRKLTVVAPASWTNVYAYTWEPEEFGCYPGSAIQGSDGVYQANIKNSMVNLVLCTLRPDDCITQTNDIFLVNNGKDVTITIAENSSYTISYGSAGVDVFRVVGNADWMGNWDSASDAGLMEQVRTGLYRKIFKNVAPGDYEFRITKNGTWDESWGNDISNYCINVVRTCDVTVFFNYHNGEGTAWVEYESLLMGDVTGDGRLNMGDVAMVFAHVRDVTAMTDEKTLARADFNRDGKINVGDVAGIYAYVRVDNPMKTVDEAYALGVNQEMHKDATLTGWVVSIIEPYNAQNGCITVSMAVPGREDCPIICSRLMGTDVDQISVNDNITVTGRLRNFYGTVEFKEGCRLDQWKDVLSPGEVMAQIVDEAYALDTNETMDHSETLMGKVISVDQPYDGRMPYVSVTIVVEGREDKPIFCYRMMGDQISEVCVDDIITVTGTLRNFYGNVEFDAGCLLEGLMPGNPGISVETDPKKIVDLAYALAENEEMPYDVTLTGKVIQIKEVYSSQYQNISVMLQVPGRETKPILLYRLKGDDISRIAVSDTITVTGRLKNFYGDVEMVNCSMTGRTSGGGTAIKPETDPAKILAAGQMLNDSEELPYTVTLSGKVVSIDDAYDDVYQNISVTISVTGTSSDLIVYRLKGDGVDRLAVGDTITVEGKIQMFYGELELVNGIMTQWTSGGGNPPVVQTDPKAIVDAAYALEEGAQLPYEVTLIGKIVALKTAYDPQYMSMTIVIAVPGREDKPIECYRIKGENVGNHLCVGDTVTVTGKIKNYMGTIEFDAGCQMTNHQSGSVTKPSDPKLIVDAAFALGENEALPYIATLTGTVKSVDIPYSDQYKNVTVTMTVQGSDGPKDIVCYRMKGEQADRVAVGNTITVSGAIKRYVRDKDGIHEDFVEFDSGCALESLYYF